MASNNEIILDYIIERGLKKNTYNNMKTVLESYSKFQDKTLQELLDEAEFEENEGIRWKNRKLKKRLINYMLYLKDNYNINSARSYFSKVKTFYAHNEIEIHKLPSWNLRNAIPPTKIKYTDLPDREIIKTAIEMSNPVMRALILFLSSTGVSRVDALDNFTIEDFKLATYEYHNSDNIREAIDIMLETDVDIIPTFEANRIKTNKYFVTFCTPECTTEILHYLKFRMARGGWSEKSPLFKIDKTYYILKFKELNDAMGLGKIGNYSRFRGHMLRKFHASNLKKGGMSVYDINILQGKSNNAVNDVYFFEDIEELKKKYIKAMGELLIFTEIKQYNQYSEEYNRIKQENDELMKQIEKYEILKKDIENIKKWYKM